jgi:hypothetical protein
VNSELDKIVERCLKCRNEKELTNKIPRKDTDNRGRRYRRIAEQVTRDAVETSRDERHESCHRDTGDLSKLWPRDPFTSDLLKNPPIRPSSTGKEDPNDGDENGPESSDPHVEEGSAKRQDTDHEREREREKQSGEFPVDGS